MGKKRRCLYQVFGLLLIILVSLTGCKKPKKVVFNSGTFPDTVLSLTGINTQYDDYNMDLSVFYGRSTAVFSSNRATQGGTFDLVTGALEYTFDKYTGEFSVTAEMINEPYLTALVNAANTVGDDLGPHRILSLTDSYEYLITTKEGPGGTLDLAYLKYLPLLGSNIPDFGALSEVSILNSTANDGYITFDATQTRVFFTSDREGQYDIFGVEKPSDITLAEWFGNSPVTVTKIDSIASDYDDKCPFVTRNIMVFTSNRPGGMGGYDLYYSVYKDGEWGSPVNFGPGINSEANEYRPILGYHPEYENYFMVFSSDRPGGKGGYDLYFAGVELDVIPTLITK